MQVFLNKILIRLRSGNLTILKNSHFADGLFLPKDMLFNWIAMMINFQVHLLEIWVIQVQFWLKKKMLIVIVISKFRCLLELMVIGKSNLYFHLIPSWKVSELMASLMAVPIAPNVSQMTVEQNVPKICLTAKLIKMMLVGIHALKTEVGNKEFIQEFIEISA